MRQEQLILRVETLRQEKLREEELRLEQLRQEEHEQEQLRQTQLDEEKMQLDQAKNQEEEPMENSEMSPRNEVRRKLKQDHMKYRQLSAKSDHFAKRYCKIYFEIL